jgi:hypothetical protein
MKTRWKLLIGAAFLAGLALVPPPFRLTLLGWLGGEPCYVGRPVSYWRYELRDWRIEDWRAPKTPKERLQDRQEHEDFVGVFDFPGEWTLQHRETIAQQWYGKWKRGSSWPNPDYGEPFCRLAILDGDPAAVPVLTVLLKDEDDRIRRLAAAALGRIGPEGKAAFPALLETANHTEDPFLRGIARVALLDIDKAAAEKAGISESFMFWSPQPKLRVTIQGHFDPSYAAFTADATTLALLGEHDATQLYDGPQAIN